MNEEQIFTLPISIINFIHFFFVAADQINEKVEKSIQNSPSQKEKSIAFNSKPLNPVKSNELGEKRVFHRLVDSVEGFRFQHLDETLCSDYLFYAWMLWLIYDY